MTARKLETALAWFSLAVLVPYVPIETWASWPHGLGHPMYLVDLVAMVLLLCGAVHSLRARPRSGLGPLAVGWAWASANGWRASSWRWLELQTGGQLEHGRGEILFVTVGTGISLLCLALCLVLMYRRPASG